MSPILLNAPRPTRDIRLAEMRSTLSKNRAHLSRLLKIQDDIATSVRLLSSYNTQLSYATASISALPLEILAIILDLACSIYHDYEWEHDHAWFVGDPWAPLRLSHVCAEWRALLLCNPHKWVTIPIATEPNEEMMLEYARRSKDLPMSLRCATNQSKGIPEAICIPRIVSGKTDALILEHPLHIDALCFDALGADLDLLILGLHDDDCVTISSFIFDPASDDRSLFTASKIACESSSISYSGPPGGLPFHELFQIDLVGTRTEHIYETLAAIDAPNLSTLIITESFDPFPYATQDAEVQRHVKGVFSRVKKLDIMGDHETLAVVAECVRGVDDPALEVLEICSTRYGEHAPALDHVAEVLAYGSCAHEIILTAAAVDLAPIFLQLHVLALNRLDRLRIRHTVSGRSVDQANHDLLAAYQMLRRLIAGIMPSRLSTLEVASALVVIDDNGWLKEHVDELIVVPDRIRTK